MQVLLLAGLLMATGLAPDTTVSLRRGDRVVVENLSGSIRVEAWDRSELSVEGWGDRVGDLSVSRSGDRVSVGSSDPKRRGLDVKAELRVPPWVVLEIRGRELDVSVAGVSADLSVQVVEGDIAAAGVGGRVTLGTVDGEIEVEDATGTLSVRSRGDDVSLRRVRGQVTAYSGSGDVVMEDVVSSSVVAETLDGNLVYGGTMSAGGRYEFSVHSGDAVISVPEGSGVRARVATYDGEFTSDFPVTLQGYGGGGVFEFVLGDGGATLGIQVFDGKIRLLSRGR